MSSYGSSKSNSLSNVANSIIKKHQNKNRFDNLYEQVTKYRDLTVTNDILTKQQEMKNFILFRDRKVMFLFGPSGSGKHLFVQKFLEKHQIPFQNREQQMVLNQTKTENFAPDFDSRKIKTLRDLIKDSIERNVVEKVQIYEDFPIATSEMFSHQHSAIYEFKNYFFKNIEQSTSKMIFILNSDIYNRHFLLPLDYGDGVSEIIFKPYGINDVKHILRDFVKKHPIFDWVMKSKDILDEIIEISGGDMRQVLLNIYRHTIKDESYKMKFMSKEAKAQYKFNVKNEQRFPLFHLIGKYAYAKRFDSIQKKDKFFRKNQLEKQDPPFYFDPVDTFLKSGVPLGTFHDLLFQNYWSKIVTIEDAKNISQLFSHLDSVFPFYITNRRLDSTAEQSQKLYVFELTWGIILKNKSSSQLHTTFSAFRKAEYNYVVKQIKNKKELLRKYFPLIPISTLINFGCIVKNFKIGQKFLISEIIKRRNKYSNNLKDENQKVLNTDEQQDVIQNVLATGTESFMKKYNLRMRKKRQEKQFIKEVQDDDDSDIQPN